MEARAAQKTLRDKMSQATVMEWNTGILQRLKSLDKKERLGHAYLFIGSARSGKSETALAVAKMLNCEGALSAKDFFCDTCGACRKITAGNHPDIHLIDTPFGETTKIDQVREMLTQVSFRPFEARQKVFILKNVESLTIEGANALLKTLEEPSSGSILILTTSVPEKIPETIRSRCHAVPFDAVPPGQIEDALMARQGMSLADARLLAYLSSGSLARAEELKAQGIDSFKEKVIREFILGRGAEEFLKDVLADKEKTRDFLDIFLIWVRDSFLVQSGVSQDKLVYSDYHREIDAFQQSFSAEDLQALQAEVVKMYKMLRENLNLKVPLLILKSSLAR